jgi:hypothetical protein
MLVPYALQSLYFIKFSYLSIFRNSVRLLIILTFNESSAHM